MTTIRTLWDRLGAWLMQHWLTIASVVVAFLFFTVLLTGKKSQDAKEAVEQAGIEKVYTKREIKRKDKAIAATQDSIRTQTIIIQKVVHVRDSAVTAARHHEAKADSLLKSHPDEDFTAPTVATAHVESFLSAYKPKPYLRAGADSLR